MTPDEFEDTLDGTTYGELCTEISDGYMGETGQRTATDADSIRVHVEAAHCKPEPATTDA